MSKKDSLDLRADDVAHALARTSAHELGHSLGMTYSYGDCGWMKGCDDGHTPLRGIAEDIRSPQRLRQSAIRAVGQSRNGRQQLEAWAQSSDPVLLTTARALLAAEMRR